MEGEARCAGIVYPVYIGGISLMHRGGWLGPGLLRLWVLCPVVLRLWVLYPGLLRLCVLCSCDSGLAAAGLVLMWPCGRFLLGAVTNTVTFIIIFTANILYIYIYTPLLFLYFIYLLLIMSQ